VFAAGIQPPARHLAAAPPTGHRGGREAVFGVAAFLVLDDSPNGRSRTCGPLLAQAANFSLEGCAGPQSLGGCLIGTGAAGPRRQSKGGKREAKSWPSAARSSCSFRLRTGSPWGCVLLPLLTLLIFRFRHSPRNQVIRIVVVQRLRFAVRSAPTYTDPPLRHRTSSRPLPGLGSGDPGGRCDRIGAWPRRR